MASGTNPEDFKGTYMHQSLNWDNWNTINWPVPTKVKILKHDVGKINFHSNIRNVAGLEYWFSSKLFGINVWHNIYDVKTLNKTSYNNWEFTASSQWDDFYYTERHLVRTKELVLGTEQTWSHTTFKTNCIQSTDVEKVTNQTVLGFPVKWLNKTTENITF